MRALAGALALGMCLTPLIVTGQTPTPSAPRPAPAPVASVGRYQLVMQPATDSLLAAGRSVAPLVATGEGEG